MNQHVVHLMNLRSQTGGQPTGQQPGTKGAQGGRANRGGGRPGPMAAAAGGVVCDVMVV